jgi:hypothetical protein
MAFKTGTATDYKDLLLQLRDFMLGVDVSPNVDRGWRVARQYTDNLSPEPADYEIIFEGTGSQSPERNLYFAVQTYENSTIGYYNWSITGLTAYASTSPETELKNQPGNIFGNQISDGPGILNGQIVAVPLQNTSMTYWFHVNGRRVIMVVKTGVSYQFMYCGFIDTYATETEYPYPLMIMGSTFQEQQVFSDNDLQYSAIPSPFGDSAGHNSAFAGIQSVGWLRFPDGEWRAVKNYYNNSNSSSAIQNYVVRLFPIAESGSTTTIDPDFVFAFNTAFDTEFFSGGQGGTPASLLAKTNNSPNDITAIWPFVMVYSDPGAVSYHLGELNNCYWCSGVGGVTSEDELFDEGVSPRNKYRVFQNIHRTDPWCFYAVKEE